MTNPHTIAPTGIDIRASADRVIAHLQQRQHAEALWLLERERADERPVVQEALDRYVVSGARIEIEQLSRSGALEAMPELASALGRLQQARQPPRMPDYSQVANEPNELVGLTEAQKHDIYASMVETRGNQAAFDALRDQDSVLLGLRKETSTVASMDDQGRRGTGVYDDHIVVLRKDANGQRHWFIADRASTEPTAQYDEHAMPRAGRESTPLRECHMATGRGCGRQPRWLRRLGATGRRHGGNDHRYTRQPRACPYRSRFPPLSTPGIGATQ